MKAIIQTINPSSSVSINLPTLKGFYRQELRMAQRIARAIGAHPTLTYTCLAVQAVVEMFFILMYV